MQSHAYLRAGAKNQKPLAAVYLLYGEGDRIEFPDWRDMATKLLHDLLEVVCRESAANRFSSRYLGIPRKFWMKHVCRASALRICV